MITRHPYRAVGAVLAVFAVSLFLAAMIGQHGDGSWGGLPEWLGTAAYVVFYSSSVVLVVLSAFLAAAAVRWRRSLR